MCCLQAFFFLVLGEQLNFNGKISSALQGQQERINHRMGSLIFFLKNKSGSQCCGLRRLCYSISGGFIILLSSGTEKQWRRHLRKHWSGHEVTVWEQEPSSGLISLSQTPQVVFLSHVSLGEAQSCFHCPVNPIFASSLQSYPQENPGDVGEHSEKGEQQLDWHRNHFGFTFMPPNPDPEIVAVQAPLQESWFAARKSPNISIFFLKFALFNKFFVVSLNQFGVLCTKQHFAGVNPCWITASSPETFSWIFPIWFEAIEENHPLKRSSSMFAASTPNTIPYSCKLPFAITHFSKGSRLWAWKDLWLHFKISII